MEQILSRQHAELAARERQLIMRVRDTLGRAAGSPEDLDRLAKLVTEMDELFLLVVAGEYNAGKSTFINALLGDEVFAMGDLPTTREISILRHGKSGPPQAQGEHTLVYHYPLEVLRDLEMVDTPGTNSMERMEEEITRGFVPRADLVLFVTTLLQPLTASEMNFLTHISEWGKIILHREWRGPPNTDEQIDRVREYIAREISSRLGGETPTIYCISALQSLREKVARRTGAVVPELDPKNEFPALEHYLVTTLREKERVQLKLMSPVGVLRTVLDRNVRTLDSRLTVMQGTPVLLPSGQRWRCRDAHGFGAIPHGVALGAGNARETRARLARAQHPRRQLPAPAQQGCSREPLSLRGNCRYAA
jgi:hypothetical protein